MDSELSLEEFEARLSQNLAHREHELVKREAENQQFKELLEKKRLLLAGLKSFLSEFAAENARLDTAISKVMTARY